MELFLKGQDAINDDLPGEDPEVVAEAIDGEAGPLNGWYFHLCLMINIDAHFFYIIYI
jgi:hypothetical protein